MRYRKEDYTSLRLVPNPDNDCGFDVIDAATGRPVSGIVEVKVTKGVGTSDVRTQPPQKVEITLLGIPVDMSLPDWGTYYHAKMSQQVARERAAQERAAQEKASHGDLPALPPAVPDADVA